MSLLAIGIISAIVALITTLVLMPEIPEIPESPEDKNYGFQGKATEYNLGTKKPIVYGRTITPGKVISQQITSESKWTEPHGTPLAPFVGTIKYLNVCATKQHLDLLVLLSAGEIEGIRREDDAGIASFLLGDKPWIKVNDKFLSEYEGYYWSFQPGVDSQYPLGSRNGTTYQDSHVLNYEWFELMDISGGEEMTGCRFNIHFFEGCYVDSGRCAADFDVELQYKLTSSGTWLDYDINQGKCLCAKSTSSFFWTFEATDLTSGLYDFRVRVPLNLPIFEPINEEEAGKRHRNRMRLTSHTIISQERFSYPGDAVVRITLAADEDFGSLQPDLKIKIDGRKVQAYNGTAWQPKAFTRNPAWIIHDFVYDKKIGLGNHFNENLEVAEAFYDLGLTADMLVSDGQGGTESKFQCDVVIDGDKDPLKIVSNLLAASESEFAISGDTFYPVLRHSRPPTFLLGMGDLTKKTKSDYKETWKSLSELNNVIEIIYYDEEMNYEKNVVHWPHNQALLGVNEQVRKKTITFRSVSRQSQAFRLAKGIYLINKYLNHGIEFPVNEDTLAMEPGDVFYFSHDLPAFGMSGGVFRERSNTEIELDNYSELIDTGTYTYDLAIRDLDTDTIVRRAVTNVTEVANKRHVVTVGTPFSFIPSENDRYILARTGMLKEYTVKRISRDESHKGKISAIEHFDEIYDTETESFGRPTQSMLPNPNAAPGNPYNLTLTKVVDRAAFLITCINPDSYQFSYCKIFVSDNGTDWVEFKRIREVQNVVYDQAIVGLTYYVKVVAYNSNGVPCETPAIDSIILKGLSLPPQVRGQEIFNQGNDNEFGGKHCKISWAQVGVTGGLGNEPNGFGTEGTGLSEGRSYEIKDTLVEVYVSGSKVREEYIKEYYYTYSYEKNVEDNGTPAREFSFKLKYRDHYNQVSDKYAFLEVFNSAPDMSSITPVAESLIGVLKVDWTTPIDKDLDKFLIYCDTNANPSCLVGTVSGQVNSFNIPNLIVNTNYYVKVVPYDVFGIGVASSVASGAVLVIPTINIDDELQKNLEISDSLGSSATALAELYDRDYSNGIAYSANDWVQYRYPIEDIINSLAVWSNNNTTRCYFSISVDGTNWDYFGALAGHGLDNDKLIEYTEGTAQANYWLMDAGANSLNYALLPDSITAKYVRIHLLSGCTLREFQPRRMVLAEDIVAESITSKQIASNTITASQIATDTITASQINGSGFGTLTLSSGKIEINTSDALEINSAGGCKVKSGGDVTLESGANLVVKNGGDIEVESGGDIIMQNSSTDSSKIVFYDHALIPEAIATLTCETGLGVNNTIILKPSAGSTINDYLYLGDSSATFNNIYLYGTTVRTYRLLPLAHKVYDLGSHTEAWDDCYADDFHNVADFYFLDDKNDLATLHSIKGSGIRCEYNGLELIDDDTLPEWLISKHKKDGENYKKGEAMYTPEGAPYLSLRTMISLLMGAVREVDNKVIAMEGNSEVRI